MTEYIDFHGTATQAKNMDVQDLMSLEWEISKKVLDTWPAIQTTDSKTWTKQLLDELKQLGRDQGYLVPPFRLGGNTHQEWLFDLVWMEGNPNPKGRNDKEKVLVKWEEIKTISRMVLACESEFGGYEADLVEDFMKLVYCNADFRLFIYLNGLRREGKEFKSGKVLRSGEGTGTTNAVEVCRDCCQTPMNQRYLMIGLPCEGETEFRINAWVR
jgi:hypothetical protein